MLEQKKNAENFFLKKFKRMLSIPEATNDVQVRAAITGMLVVANTSELVFNVDSAEKESGHVICEISESGEIF
jgi:hypothetical protein